MPEKLDMSMGIHGGKSWTRKNTCADGRGMPKKIRNRMEARLKAHEAATRVATTKNQRCMQANKPGSVAKARVA